MSAADWINALLTAFGVAPVLGLLVMTATEVRA
jgi:hypothetical protein